jgi:hypothetical protein
MKLWSLVAVDLLSVVGVSRAGYIPHADLGELVARQTTTTAAASTTTHPPDSVCTNGPLTRQCWYNGFSIAT